MTLPLKRIQNDDRSGYFVGSHFAVLQYQSSWEVRRVCVNDSPYGELLNRFKTRRDAIAHAEAVAKNEGKYS
ncbi:MAG: hypothetical protein LLG14_27545 [Nocardiaceae bacterium]|nr:hypothetical protein [Nocardiaceae bacterium]